MSTVLDLRPTRIPSTTSPDVEPPRRRTIETVVSEASDVVAILSLDDPRWDVVGPVLTSFVHAARLAVGMPGSPIRPEEAVAPVLRLRDLGRLAQRVVGNVAFADPGAEARLRSLRAVASL